MPQGVTITCTGANANGQTGAGAGIELTVENTLCLLGGGKLVATGGNAANGSEGGYGGNASFKESEWVRSGDGGRGGDGGGGFGGAASDIGNGGPGGGGGGSSGSITWKAGVPFYQVGALGGNPGANADGTLASAGKNTLLDKDD